jgi:F-type H+-transporting ATPase subunit gamma
MPSLKAIRKRISSVKNTQKITKAMKMVAAAKLRRAQEGVTAMRPYGRRMKQVALDLAERLSEEALPHEDEGVEGEEGGEGERVRRQPWRMIQVDEERRIRLVVVTSDRGLAGAFNSNINRRTERFLVEKKGPEIDLDVLGKKGREYLRRRKLKIHAERPGVESKNAAEVARELSATLSRDVMTGRVDAVYVVYNEFKSAASQAVKVERVLPLRQLARPRDGEGEEAEQDVPRVLIDFLYEPSRREVLEHLIPLYVETEMHRIFLESIASEFGARMSAMDNASRNAKEMISRLTLQFNRARQAAITKELMEIVGGAEALKG